MIPIEKLYHIAKRYAPLPWIVDFDDGTVSYERKGRTIILKPEKEMAGKLQKRKVITAPCVSVTTKNSVKDTYHVSYVYEKSAVGPAIRKAYQLQGFQNLDTPTLFDI
jgi:hypothetical protein